MSCDCKNGWRAYWPAWRQDWMWQDYILHPAEMVPCPCPVGIWQARVCADYAKMPENRRAKIETMRTQAVRHEGRRLQVGPNQAEIDKLSANFKLPLRVIGVDRPKSRQDGQGGVKRVEVVQDDVQAYTGEF